jgi:hypothetical protein
MILSGKEMSYQDYRKKVDRITKVSITENNIVVPEGHEVDHIFPVSYGYQLGIPAHVVGDISNLQVMLMGENRKKSNKCDSIPPFIQGYMLGTAKEVLSRKKPTDQKQRKKPSVSETKEQFMSKPNMENVYILLSHGYKHKVIARTCKVSLKTVTKVKNYMSKELEKKMKDINWMKEVICKHGIGSLFVSTEWNHEQLLRFLNIFSVIDILNLFRHLNERESLLDPNITYFTNSGNCLVMVYDKKLKSISFSSHIWDFIQSFFDRFKSDDSEQLSRIIEINRTISNWFYKNHDIRVKYMASEYNLYGETGHKFIMKQDPLFNG